MRQMRQDEYKETNDEFKKVELENIGMKKKRE